MVRSRETAPGFAFLIVFPRWHYTRDLALCLLCSAARIVEQDTVKEVLCRATNCCRAAGDLLMGWVEFRHLDSARWHALVSYLYTCDIYDREGCNLNDLYSFTLSLLGVVYIGFFFGGQSHSENACRLRVLCSSHLSNLVSGIHTYVHMYVLIAPA